MYDYIAGKLIRKRATEVVVDVAGVGYLLKISLSTYQDLPAEGEAVLLKVYLHVREDLMQLFGFFTEDERAIFNGLISVAGVGPKLAQTILSGLTPDKLIRAVKNNDEKQLSAIAGIGKKTAQRLIIELKDKFDKLVISGMEDVVEQPVVLFNEVEQETLMALVSLGYNRFAAEKAIARIRQSERILTVEEYVKQALQAI